MGRVGTRRRLRRLNEAQNEAAGVCRTPIHARASARHTPHVCPRVPHGQQLYDDNQFRLVMTVLGFAYMAHGWCYVSFFFLPLPLGASSSSTACDEAASAACRSPVTNALYTAATMSRSQKTISSWKMARKTL